MKLEVEIEIKDIADLLRIAAVAVTAAAVIQELQKHPAERTWRGEVLGVVPYDFRAPDLRRFQATYWNPTNPELFVPTAFGIGWGLNIPTLARNVWRLAADASGAVRERLPALR